MKKVTSRPVYANIDEYIASRPVEVRATLQKLRHVIRYAVPGAEELISYQMPAFKYHGILMYFASFKEHYSIFVRPRFLQAFHDELRSYRTTKSAIHIPRNTPVPVRLVTKIARHIAAQNSKAQNQKFTSRKV